MANLQGHSIQTISACLIQQGEFSQAYRRVNMQKNAKKATFALGVFAASFAIFVVVQQAKVEAHDHKKYSVTEIVERLEERGFYGIRVTDRNPPLYDMYACYKGKRYELTIDHHGNIRDKDDEGRCRHRKSTYIEAPYTSVDVNDGVRVRAPFVGVDVDRHDGVRVRAPFVDIRVK